MQLAIPIKEAAEAVGLSHWSLRKLIRQGRLATIRINNRILIEPSALRQLIDDSKGQIAHDGK